MAGYPITLQLNGKRILIVGGGKVAARKVPALLAAGAKLTILSPNLDKSLQTLPLNWIQADYSRSLLENLRPALLFAATNQPEVNQAIRKDAQELGIWLNLADDAESSDFHNMATIDKSPFTIAISSAGSSPALLRLLKERIDAVLSDGLIALAHWLGAIRSKTRDKLQNQSERQALYERIIASDVLALLEAGKDEEAQALFNQLVEEALL